MKRKLSSTDALDAELVALIRESGVEAVVLDLDSTIWNGNCDGFSDFVQVSEQSVCRKSDNRALHLFPDVAPALQALHGAGVLIAIASASPTEGTAHRLLRAFGVSRFISHAVVRPGNKATHLNLIREKLGLRTLQRTLFFDDLEHNIRTVRGLGCTAVRVRGYCSVACSAPCNQHGLSALDVSTGLREVQRTQRSADRFKSFFAAPKPPALATSSSQPSNTCRQLGKPHENTPQHQSAGSNQPRATSPKLPSLYTPLVSVEGSSTESVFNAPKSVLSTPLASAARNSTGAQCDGSVPTSLSQPGASARGDGTDSNVLIHSFDSNLHARC